MSNRLGGRQGSSYLGTNAFQPPECWFESRDPTMYDTRNYSVLDLWVNEINRNVWVLVSLERQTTGKGQVADWRNITFDSDPLLYATYYLAANVPNITGDGTLYVPRFTQTLSAPTLTGYDTSSGQFIAPEDGMYSFNTCISLSNINDIGYNNMTATMTCTGTGPDTGTQGYATHLMNAYDVSSGDAGVAGDIRYNQSIIFVLNAGDRVYPTIIVSGGAKTIGLSIGYAPSNVPATSWITIKKIK